MESGKINSVAGDSIARMLFDSVLAARPAAVSRGYRIANIERLRILSAAAIVCFHTCGDLSIARHLGTVGILVFLITLCAFVVNRPEPLDPAIAIKRKARRLLKPWLFWSMVYGILPLLKVFHRGVPFSDAFGWAMLVTGTRIHLWFLPFAFAAALLLVLIHRALADVSNPHIVTTAIVMGALSVFGFSIVQSCLQPPTPVRQWILGAPAIVLGGQKELVPAHDSLAAGSIRGTRMAFQRFLAGLCRDVRISVLRVCGCDLFCIAAAGEPGSDFEEAGVVVIRHLSCSSSSNGFSC
jgi:hypothetical protein